MRVFPGYVTKGIVVDLGNTYHGGKYNNLIKVRVPEVHGFGHYFPKITIDNTGTTDETRSDTDLPWAVIQVPTSLAHDPALTSLQGYKSAHYAVGDYVYVEFPSGRINDILVLNHVVPSTNRESRASTSVIPVDTDNYSGKVGDFLKVAEVHIGEYYKDWVQKIVNGPDWMYWCAAFVSACAKVSESTSVIYTSTSVTTMVTKGVEQKMGVFLSGNNIVPSPGDLIVYNWDGPYSHVGIVYRTSGTSIKTIEGNRGSEDPMVNRVKYCDESVGNSTIQGYYRPNWVSYSSRPPR